MRSLTFGMMALVLSLFLAGILILVPMNDPQILKVILGISVVAAAVLLLMGK